MQQLWDGVAAELASVPTIGGQRYVDRHRKRGKMLVRERIEALVDPDTPFLELSPLAGWGTQDPVGVGSCTGIGIVEGVECAISGSDMTYRGGRGNPTTWKKGSRFHEIARKNWLPVIVLNESAGADLPRQADLFIQGGASFKDLTQLSKMGIPSITMAFGPNTAGGAYTPGMSDYTVFVKERGTGVLGGPPLVKMAIDEIVDEETLGGAEMHSRTSGLSDYLAVDELDAIRITRGIVRHLRWNKLGPGATQPDDPPLYDPAELLGCAAADVRIPFDIREALACSTAAASRNSSRCTATSSCAGGDRSTASRSASSATTGSCSRKRRRRVPSSSSCATSATSRLARLHNITGFMVGSKAEQGGIIRNGAKLINAVSNSTVPHFNLMVGASYGAGNYGMAGKAYNPRFYFSWPNHRAAVMGPKQLAGVMEIVARNAGRRTGHWRSTRRRSPPRPPGSKRRSNTSRRRCTRPGDCGTTGSSTLPTVAP